MPEALKGRSAPVTRTSSASPSLISASARSRIAREEEGKSAAAVEMGRKGGRKRAESMTPEQRAEIARKAAAQCWKKPRRAHLRLLE
jgi:hypothetical protein